ncbi:MAG: hypothetical protein JXR91_14005 [Deltaproteobacteria bacterium]|nr:hypothetical protein [Deltaproteobacteria bacterium]
MIRLIKFIISFTFFAIFVYFAFFVPLGSKTLYQHVLNISKTDEAKELTDGIASKAEAVKNEVVKNAPAVQSGSVAAGKELLNTQVKKEESSKNEKPEVAKNRDTQNEQKDSIISHKDKTALDSLLKSKL